MTAHFNIENLKTFGELVDELLSTNSRLEKESILDKYSKKEGIVELLQYTYNPDYTYGVSSKNCLDNERVGGLTITNNLTLQELLDKLISRELSGDNAIGYVNYFIQKYNVEVLYKILDKDLNCGISISTINKIIPGCVKQVKIQLAERVDRIKKSALTSGAWYLSEKKDGQRMITIIENGEVHFYARGGDKLGKEILSLENLKPYIKEFYKGSGFASSKDIPAITKISEDYVLDGEVIIEKEGRSNIDNCRYTSSQMRRGSKNNPEQVQLLDSEGNKVIYYVFDCIKKEEFYQEKGKDVYTERTGKLWLDWFRDNKHIKVLKQEYHLLSTQRDFEEIFSKPIEEGKEGYILRRDCEYKGKRSMDMLKIKKKERIELEVYDIEETTKSMLNENGVMEEVSCLGAVYAKGIDRDGEKIVSKVGSGFSDELRVLYYNEPSLILGETITVEYTEVSESKAGAKSLRNPVFVCIRKNNE